MILSQEWYQVSKSVHYLNVLTLLNLLTRRGARELEVQRLGRTCRPVDDYATHASCFSANDVLPSVSDVYAICRGKAQRLEGFIEDSGLVLYRSRRIAQLGVYLARLFLHTREDDTWRRKKGPPGGVLSKSLGTYSSRFRFGLLERRTQNKKLKPRYHLLPKIGR